MSEMASTEAPWDTNATNEYDQFFTNDEPASTKMINLEGKSEYTANGGGVAAVGAAGAAAAGGAFAAVVSAAAGFADTATKSNVSSAVSEVLSTQAIDEVKKKYGKYVKGLRPWREFFLNYAKPAKGEGFGRVMGNFYAFQTNYVLLFLVYFATQVMQDTASLLLILAACVVWAGFSKKNEDPEWNPTIAGIALPPGLRSALLMALTVVMFLIVAGNLLISSGLCFLVLAALHACMHAPPVEPADVAPAPAGADTVDL